MKEETDLLAYCGLYCGDCAGYSGDIAEAAQHLKQTVERYKFHQTAKHLFAKELHDYESLRKMIDFMTQLKCPKPCRQKTVDEAKCEILKCCRQRGFYACHECTDFESCNKLQPLSGLHGESCIKNLRAIKEMGIENWIRNGKRLWFADDE
jgi:hypothetical protein